MKLEPGALCGFSCLITCLSSLRAKACRFTERWVFVASFFDVWIPGVVMRGKHLREMGSEELDFYRVALSPGFRVCRIFTDRVEGCLWFFRDLSAFLME